jgi:hypothetical protein
MILADGVIHPLVGHKGAPLPAPGAGLLLLLNRWRPVFRFLHLRLPFDFGFLENTPAIRRDLRRGRRFYVNAEISGTFDFMRKMLTCRTHTAIRGIS